MGTPTTELASKIVKKLVEVGLLRPADEKKMAAKLADGSMNSQDWRLAIELSEGKDGP
jgi:hypothetical protein